MPNLPPVYHKLMALLDEPDLTETQSILIRMTANLMAQDAVEGTDDEEDLSKTIDSRLQFTRDIFYKMPDRFELIDGMIHAKDWDTPNLQQSAKDWKEADDIVRSRHPEGFDHSERDLIDEIKEVVREIRTNRSQR